MVSLCNPVPSLKCTTFTTLGENSSFILCQKKKILFSQWLTYYCVGHPHTPSLHCQSYTEERRWCTDEQNSMNWTDCTHRDRLSQQAGAHRLNSTQRWALVLSTIDRDVINVLTGFLLMNSGLPLNLNILLTIIRWYECSVAFEYRFRYEYAMQCRPFFYDPWCLAWIMGVTTIKGHQILVILRPTATSAVFLAHRTFAARCAKTVQS